jgi:diamine N-acetyltransferase
LITFREATSHDFKLIQDIAYATWPETYGQILSKAQLDYMLGNFYSLENLHANCNAKQLFYIIEEEKTPQGFLGIEHHYNSEKITKIHKIYILPNYQGKGIGKLALDFIANLAKDNQSKKLRLNVNKYNKAIDFYKKIAFEITSEVVIEIGNGWAMDDYVMEKVI